MNFGYSGAKVGIFFLFAGYLSIAFVGAPGAREPFPVFNWSLFSEVRDPRSEWELEIIRVGDRVYDPPVNYFDLGDRFPEAGAKNVRATKTLNNMMRAIRNDDPRAMILHEVLEEGYLQIDDPVEYRIVLTVFSPLERYRTGKLMRKVEVMRGDVEPRN